MIKKLIYSIISLYSVCLYQMNCRLWMHKKIYKKMNLKKTANLTQILENLFTERQLVIQVIQ
jgi:hypothetical protein